MTTERAARARPAALAVALALAVLGCGGRDELPATARRTVAIAEVPEVAREAAKKAAPGVAFDEAWKNVDRDGKLHSYEIRGRAADGKIREVRVSPDGKVLEME